MELPAGLAVKDSALSLLRHGFYPWPGNFHMPQAWPKKKKKKKETKIDRTERKKKQFYNKGRSLHYPLTKLDKQADRNKEIEDLTQ